MSVSDAARPPDRNLKTHVVEHLLPLQLRASDVPVGELVVVDVALRISVKRSKCGGRRARDGARRRVRRQQTAEQLDATHLARAFGADARCDLRVLERRRRAFRFLLRVCSLIK